MKIGSRIFLIIVLLSFQLQAEEPVCRKHYRVALGHYPPFSFLNADQQWQGIDVDAVHSLFTRAKCQFEIVDLNFKRALQYIAEGKIDMMAATSATKERHETAYFSIPYRNEIITLVGKKGLRQSIATMSVDDLLYEDNYTIAFSAEAFYGEAVRRAVQADFNQIALIPAGDAQTRLKLVDKGMVDLAIIEEQTARSLLKSLELKNELVIMPMTLNISPIYFMFSKKSVTVDEFNYLNQLIGSSE